jgi:hypothetical protein
VIDPDLLQFLDDEELAELDQLTAPADGVDWSPQEGPQLAAFHSDADVIGYGGAAGGGKTDLICGKGLKQHRRVLVIRRQKDQTKGITQRLTEILGSSDGYSSQGSVWRVPNGPLFEFGGLDNPGDETKWQGRPHDLKAFDEATEMRESQVRFIMGWNRSNIEGQRSQTLLTFNPPMTTEGRWVIAFFAPWLDSDHPNPAVPGELRWFTTQPDADGKPKDTEVPDGRPFVLRDGERVYDFNFADERAEDILQPKSRTFFPARVSDNQYYLRTGYVATLQALPEPMRSRMLYGSFRAGIKDDPWQMIPTRWIEAAMERWVKPTRLPPMTAMGVDVARGGDDETTLARRHGRWFDELIRLPGADTPDGPAVAGQVIMYRRDRAVVQIDAIGVGSSPYDFLRGLRVPIIGVDCSRTATEMDQSGIMRFRNIRTQMWWKLREALDPANNFGLMLPKDKELLRELTAPLWKPDGLMVVMESRADILKRIGRSVDGGTAVCLAWLRTPNVSAVEARIQGTSATYSPLDIVRRAP